MRLNVGKNATAEEKKLMKLFTKIAQEQLFVETLEERRSDSLDFHDCSVIGIRDALLEAYRAGQTSQ